MRDISISQTSTFPVDKLITQSFQGQSNRLEKKALLIILRWSHSCLLQVHFRLQMYQLHLLISQESQWGSNVRFIRKCRFSSSSTCLKVNFAWTVPLNFILRQHTSTYFSSDVLRTLLIPSRRLDTCNKFYRNMQYVVSRMTRMSHDIVRFVCCNNRNFKLENLSEGGAFEFNTKNNQWKDMQK